MRSIYENSPLSPIPVYLFVTTVPSEKHWPLNNVTMKPWIASCSLPRTSWLSTNETEIKVKRNFSAPWCDHFKINKFVSYLVISQSEIGDFYWSLILITQRRKLFWKEKGWVGETQRVWFTLDRVRLYSRDQSPASCWRHIWDSLETRELVSVWKGKKAGLVKPRNYSLRWKDFAFILEIRVPQVVDDTFDSLALLVELVSDRWPWRKIRSASIRTSLHFFIVGFITVNDLLNTEGVYLILGVLNS